MKKDKMQKVRSRLPAGTRPTRSEPDKGLSIEEFIGRDMLVYGIPLCDIPSVMLRHASELELRNIASNGLDYERMSEVMRVVSPLVLEPRPSTDRRFIFAAVADRVVPPEQARKLWEHWEQPRIEWYQGAHITFRAHPNVRRLIEEGLQESALTL